MASISLPRMCGWSNPSSWLSGVCGLSPSSGEVQLHARPAPCSPWRVLPLVVRTCPASQVFREAPTIALGDSISSDFSLSALHVMTVKPAHQEG
jgi:hypothetical protein